MEHVRHVNPAAGGWYAHAPLKALLVDDEDLGRCALADLIKEYCSDIDVVGMAASAEEARQAVGRLEPDVVFLDVKMPGESGFQFLESLRERHFLVVFVSAYDEYALRAIKANAVDYLIKPVKITDLRLTVRTIREQHRLLSLDKKSRADYALHIESLLDSIHNPGADRKIILKHSKGFDVVALHDIVQLAAERNYTSVHMSSGRTILVSRTLSDFASMLDPESFFRTHKSHLINLAYLDGYTFDDIAYAILRGGEKVEISRRRMAAFFQAVKNYTHCPD